MSPRVLSHAEARAWYDRFATLQDLQRFYEDAVTDELLARAALERARAVVDFGCGTGRLAERLLAEHLGPDATYVGFDVSGAMVERTRARVAPWGTRARAELTDGRPRVPLDDASADRFICTFVLDLLDEADIRALLDEAHRVLVPGGLLCVASLSSGDDVASRRFTRAWMALHRVHPALVGGCRAIELAPYLVDGWGVLHRQVVRPFALSSETVIAERREE